jgi:hypothetical protein
MPFPSDRAASLLAWRLQSSVGARPSSARPASSALAACDVDPLSVCRARGDDASSSRSTSRHGTTHVSSVKLPCRRRRERTRRTRRKDRSITQQQDGRNRVPCVRSCSEALSAVCTIARARKKYFLLSRKKRIDWSIQGIYAQQKRQTSMLKRIEYA